MKKVLSLIFCLFFIVTGLVFAEEAYKYDGPVWNGPDGYKAQGHINVFEFSDTTKWQQVQVTPCPSGAQDFHIVLKATDPNTKVKIILVITSPPTQETVVIYAYKYVYEGYLWVFENSPNEKMFKFLQRAPLKPQTTPVPADPQKKQTQPSDDGMG